MAGSHRHVGLVVWLLASCGDSEPPSPAVVPASSAEEAFGEIDPAFQDDPETEVPAAAGAERVSAAAAKLFPANTGSLRLRRSIAVRVRPDADAELIGTIARDTRVAWTAAATGPGCESRWIEIKPAGWVCQEYLEPNKRGPRAVELPKLKHGELVPGRYGKVISEDPLLYSLGEPNVDGEREILATRPLEGSVTVREYGTTDVEGEHLWHVGRGDWIREEDLQVHTPDSWRGIRLGDETGVTLPVVLAVSKKNPIHRVRVYADASDKNPVGYVRQRSRLDIKRTTLNKDGVPVFHEIGDAQWVRAEDTRTLSKAAPPPLTGPIERWVDVDLSAQSLVAYEGSEPVYATLVSTGTRKYPSETGIFRVWIKFAETDMNGQMVDEAPYSMATVPWTQFYAKDLALHTAYWHDKFGTRKSHGCVNLSPLDSRFLYFWSDPRVPPGWSMANGFVEVPGSMVRVRSAADPNPEFKGYAARVQQARLAATP